MSRCKGTYSDNNVESTSNPDESTQKEIDEIRRDLNATKDRLATIEEEVGEIQTGLGIRTRWTEKEVSALLFVFLCHSVL